jgi:hypothetical protein
MAERTRAYLRASRAARHSRPSRWRRESPDRREAREPTPSAGPGAAKETPGVTFLARTCRGWDAEPGPAVVHTAGISGVPRRASDASAGTSCGVWGCYALRTETGDAGCLAGGWQPDRMETCGPEEPDEGNLHVRFCGGIGWQQPILPGSCQVKSVTLESGGGSPRKLVFAV